VFFGFLALWTLISGVVSLLAPAAMWIYQARLDPLAIALSACSLASLAALLTGVGRRKPELTLAAVACAAFFTTANVYAAAWPHLDSLWISPRIAEAAKTLKPCAKSLLISTPDHEPSLVFLNGPYDTFLAGSPQQAADQMASTGSCALAVVGEREQPAFLARAAEHHLQLRPVGQLQGRDYADNKLLKLTFYTAAPAPAASH